MGIKDSVKNLIDKVKTKYDDYCERKRIEAEEEAERIRLNTPIIECDDVYKCNINVEYAEDEEYCYEEYTDCYEKTDLMLRAEVFPQRFQLTTYEKIEKLGSKIFEDDFYIKRVEAYEHFLIRTKYRNYTYYTFYQHNPKLMTSEEEDMVLFAIKNLEESYYVTRIISELEPYSVFSKRITSFLDRCLSTYLQDKYEEYKKSSSHEEAKTKALNRIKPYKDILNKKSKQYEDMYQEYLNREKAKEIKRRNEKNDLINSYRDL